MEKNPIVENRNMLIAYLKAGIDTKVDKKECSPLLKECSDELYNLHLKGELFKESK